LSVRERRVWSLLLLAMDGYFGCLLTKMSPTRLPTWVDPGAQLHLSAGSPPKQKVWIRLLWNESVPGHLLSPWYLLPGTSHLASNPEWASGPDGSGSQVGPTISRDAL
jgi:hypothetical protein